MGVFKTSRIFMTEAQSVDASLVSVSCLRLFIWFFEGCFNGRKGRGGGDVARSLVGCYAKTLVGGFLLLPIYQLWSCWRSRWLPRWRPSAWPPRSAASARFFARGRRGCAYSCSAPPPS